MTVMALLRVTVMTLLRVRVRLRARARVRWRVQVTWFSERCSVRPSASARASAASAC